MITRNTNHLAFKEDLFLKPQKQEHMNAKRYRISTGYHEVRGLPKVYQPHDWLTDWQENNER